MNVYVEVLLIKQSKVSEIRRNVIDHHHESCCVKEPCVYRSISTRSCRRANVVNSDPNRCKEAHVSGVWVIFC